MSTNEMSRSHVKSSYSSPRLLTKRLLLFVLPAALWAQTQTCTTTSSAGCPSSGAPTAGDQFGDTVSWTSSPAGIFAAPEGGQDFQDFISGAGTAFTGISDSFSLAPANNILYSAEFTPLNQDFFLSDPASCPAAGPPTCLYNNVAYAEAFADSLFKRVGHGGVGLPATDINLDAGPWFMSSQYATYCAAYSSSTVTQGTACFTPPTSPTNYQASLTSSLNTYIAVLDYIMKNYPQVKIHFSPTPSADIWATCGLSVAGRTEAAVEACMVPLYQAMVATVSTTRFTALHEAAGAWGLFCGACPFLSTPANVDTFLQHASVAIKAVSPSTAVGVGGAFSEMGISAGGGYVCPNSGGSLNYWCDYTTIDPFLDYVGMDLYPSMSGVSADYASLIGTSSPQTSTYDFMAARADSAPYSVPVYVNESSALRWSIPGGKVGSGEPDTYLGAGWIGWATTNTWSGWLESAPVQWAKTLRVQGWDYFDAPALLCLSSDPNNTHVAPNTDNYMANCMKSLPAVSTLGTMYGDLAQTSAPPFTLRLSTAGQIVPFGADSIVAAYGTNLATGTATLSTVPPPTSLDSNSVTVTDSSGITRDAPLFYVSPTQVNFEIPASTASGTAMVTIQNANGTTQSATVPIGAVSPGFYSLDSSGLIAAYVLPVISGKQQPLISVYQTSNGKVEALPINLGGSDEQVYLEMYGTGFRNATTVTATIGNLSVPVLYAGASSYSGEDQVNIGPIPPSLAGKGSVTVVVTADDKAATGNVTIQ
jgi:uncharacterized protein (TIGR03437 family)